MISQVDDFIKQIEKKEKIINYLKTIYRIEIGDEPIVPEAYIEKGIIEDGDTNTDNKEYATFSEKVESFRLPDISDKNIKLKIQKLKKQKDTKFLLKTIDISNYGDKGFKIDILKKLVDGVKILKSVEVLNLKNNKMDDSFSDLVSDIFTIDSIKRLDLSFNNFSKVSGKKFASIIKNYKHLEFIDFTFNPLCLDDFSCTQISIAIKSHLNLFHFGLSDSSKDSVIKLLNSKPNIRSLNLDDCKYKLKSFESLFKCLADKKFSLAILFLRHTNIDGFVGFHIEKTLRLNKTLIYVNLYGCGITDKVGSKLISSLETNTTLVEIDLGFNKLSTLFCEKLSCVINVNTILNTVNLSKNILIDSSNFQCIVEALVNNQHIISLGDLTETKIGVKLRESADIILNLNRKFNENEIASELNKTQKQGFFQASTDINEYEKKNREKINQDKFEDVNIDENTINQVIIKYDIKMNEDEFENFHFFNF